MRLNQGERGTDLFKWRWHLVCLVIMALLVAGCWSRQAALPVTPMAWKELVDDAGRTIRLPQKPQRIVVLSASLLDLFYRVGGQAVGRADSNTIELPPAVASLPRLGFGNAINLEAVLALQPDLVIAPTGAGERYAPLLESNGIPVLILRLKTLADVQEKVRLFGELAGTEAEAKSLLAALTARMDDIIQRLPDYSKRVVILHATAKNITVELEHTVAGDVARRLRLENIAAGSRRLEGSQDMTPYSMEKVVEADPDIVLITLMGNRDGIERRLRADVNSNPAWANLRAVKTGQVYVLPSEFFLLNPGLRYDQALAYMAGIAFPEIYRYEK